MIDKDVNDMILTLGPISLHLVTLEPHLGVQTSS